MYHGHWAPWQLHVTAQYIDSTHCPADEEKVVGWQEHVIAWLLAAMVPRGYVLISMGSCARDECRQTKYRVSIMCWGYRYSVSVPPLFL